MTGVRVLVRYDIENLSEDAYREALGTIFLSRRWMRCLKETLSMVQTTPFFLWNTCLVGLDQRADSAEQCVKLLKETGAGH